MTVKYDKILGALREQDTISGSVAFTDLSDVPGSYTGASLKSVRVNVGETGLEFFTPSGGGSVSYPDQNILIVDPILTADGVKVFNTIAAARTYALTQTPSATNPFVIKVAGGQFADGIIITPYIAYDLQSNTRINGAITSSLGFADIASVDYSFISRGILTDLTGTAGAFFHLFDNCAIHSSTVSNAAIYAFNKSAIRNADLSAVGITTVMTGSCYVSSGTFRSLSAQGTAFNNNLGGAGVNIQSGVFIQCSFENVTIQDSVGTMSFFNCFFSETAVTWPTFTGGSVNMVGCVTNNLHTIAFSGTSPNTWIGNLNLRYSLDTETFPNNSLLNYGNINYYWNQIDYTQVSANAGASLTYSATTKNYIGPNQRIKNIAISLLSSFVGTGITALTLDVGYTGNPTAYITGYDLLQSSSGTSFIDVAINAIQNIGTNTDVLLTFTAVGANLDQLTNGVIDARVTYEEVIS